MGTSLPSDHASDGLRERTMARLRHIHSSCASPLLVPLAAAAWCAHLKTRPLVGDVEDDEYEAVEGGAQVIVHSPSLLANVLRGVSVLIAEMLSDVQASMALEAGTRHGADESSALR